MTRSDFHRSTILRGDLFSFQPDSGEVWTEPNLFDQVEPPNDEDLMSRLLPTDDRGLELPAETAHNYGADDDDSDGPFYCPHGTEVDTPGGACYWCAQEDANDSDY